MTRSDVRAAALLVVLLVGTGVVAGVVWWWVSPQPGYRAAADGLLFLDPQPEAYVAADGWFALITGVVGAVAGVLVWLRLRGTPWGGLLGLFVGALAGAAAAAGVGMLLGRSDPWSAPVGSLTQGALELRAWGVLLVEAGLAVAAWLLLDVLALPPAEPTPEAAPPAEGALDGRVAGEVDGPAGPVATDYGAARDL